MIKGLDVSEWQGKIDWQQVVRAGYFFVFIKASEGETRKDPRASQNWRASKSAGLATGVYHYFLATKDPLKQARLFLQVIESIAMAPGDLPPVVDVEDYGNKNAVSPQELAQKLQVFLQEVERGTGRRPIIYLSPYFWKDHLASFTETGYPLWIAHYGVAKPSLPKIWNTWTFWQYSKNGAVSGINGNVDLDLFNGDEEALWRLAGLLHDDGSQGQ